MRRSTSALALMLLLLSACAPRDFAATASPSTLPPRTEATPSTAPSSTATAAATPTDTGLSANALGALSGSWIFFTRRVPLAFATYARLEVWGLPTGGTPRLAFSYSVPLGGVPEAPLDNNPYLRRQFSPDGRQVVVSTLTGLVVVDLASGQSRALGVPGQFPSWSRDGSTVAYIATVSRPDPQVAVQELAIWTVPSSGGATRELVSVGHSIRAPEWAPDGTAVLAQLRDGVGLIDVASGREVPGGRIPLALSMTGAHWRAGLPAATAILRRDDTQLVTYDRASGVTSLLAQFARPYDPSPCRCPKGMVPQDPRWSPLGSAEILFVLTDENTGRAEAAIVHTPSGRITKTGTDVTEATWSADARQVVYIARSSGGGALRAWDRGTGADHELVRLPVGTPNGTAHLSLTLVVY